MDGQKTSFKTRLACFLLAFVLSLGAYAFIEPRMLLVREYTVGSARVPEAFDGLSIAFVADVHLGDYFPLSAVRHMVARVNALRPDLVLLGGDYVGYDAKYIAPAFEALGGLCAPMGVYGVLGNHDNWADAALCRAEAARHGITLVDNRMLWLKRGRGRVALAGVGDLDTDVCDITPVQRGTKDGDYVVLLSHNPDYIEQMQSEKVDLMLSGHMHGGQVTLFGLVPLVVPSRTGGKYVSGMYQKDGTTLIVTNGVGVSVFPVRFCAPPQIVHITLKRE